jgi:NADPH2:quinone reductase
LVRQGALAPHGTVACYGSNEYADPLIPFRVALFNTLSFQFFLVYDLTPSQRAFALTGINDLLASSKLVHAIGARYPLSETIAAHEAVEQGKVMGNAVITIA